MSGRSRRKAGTGVDYDYAHETFLRVIGLYCRPIFLMSMAIYGCAAPPLYGAIRFHEPKYHEGETRGFTVMFIDPRHLRRDTFVRCFTTLSKRFLREEVAPGNCAEVLIAKGIKYCNYSAIKQKPREIAKGNVSTCTFPRSQCAQTLRAVQGELDLELSICRKC